MQHKYNIGNLLLTALAHKGAFYPGIFVNGRDKTQHIQSWPNFDNIPQASALEKYTTTGTPIRKTDYLGRLYFMPVIISVDGLEIEMPHAVISMSGKKTIIETPLTGRNGSVKELISVDDYDISITGVILSKDKRNYPEAEVRRMRELYELNHSIELISAISDIGAHLAQYSQKIHWQVEHARYELRRVPTQERCGT